MERIGDEVRRTMSRFGPQAGMGELVRVWPEAVGEAIARNAWPSRIARDGTLHVAVSSSAWAFELSQLAPAILPRLRAALGGAAPAAVRFAPGRLPEAALDTATQDRRPVAPGPEHEAAAAELVTAIGDENLRKVVAKSAALSLAKAAADRSV
jgi:hypothetical protein